MTSLSLVLYNTVPFAHPEEVPPLPPLTFSCLQNLMALHQLYSRHVVSIFHSVQLYLHICTDTGDPPSQPPPPFSFNGSHTHPSCWLCCFISMHEGYPFLSGRHSTAWCPDSVLVQISCMYVERQTFKYSPVGEYQNALYKDSWKIRSGSGLIYPEENLGSYQNHRKAQAEVPSKAKDRVRSVFYYFCYSFQHLLQKQTKLKIKMKQ